MWRGRGWIQLDALPLWDDELIRSMYLHFLEKITLKTQIIAYKRHFCNNSRKFAIQIETSGTPMVRKLLITNHQSKQDQKYSAKKINSFACSVLFPSIIICSTLLMLPWTIVATKLSFQFRFSFSTFIKHCFILCYSVSLRLSLFHTLFICFDRLFYSTWFFSQYNTFLLPYWFALSFIYCTFSGLPRTLGNELSSIAVLR